MPGTNPKHTTLWTCGGVNGSFTLVDLDGRSYAPGTVEYSADFGTTFEPRGGLGLTQRSFGTTAHP